MGQEEGQEEEKTVVIIEQFQVESKKRTSYYETTNNTNYIIHSRVREWYKLKSSGRGSTPLRSMWWSVTSLERQGIDSRGTFVTYGSTSPKYLGNNRNKSNRGRAVLTNLSYLTQPLIFNCSYPLHPTPTNLIVSCCSL